MKEGKIFKIIDKTTDNYFISSTFQPIESKMKSYVKKCDLYKQGNEQYSPVFKIIHKDNYYVEPIEVNNYESLLQLYTREYQILLQHIALKNCINGSTDFESSPQPEAIPFDRRTHVINCKCGGRYTIPHEQQHKRSVRHIDYFNKISHDNI